MIDVDVRVDEPLWRGVEALEAKLEAALNAAGAVCARSGPVSILLTNDAAIQTLNKNFRGKDKPTDVLSFRASEIEAPFLGDICVAYGVAKRDADVANTALGDHLAHLLVHGLLHLAGHDHEVDTEAEKMEALEIRALASIGIANPYV